MMEDRDLEILGRMHIPEPHEERKAAALSAALRTFDEDETSPQGNNLLVRLTLRAANFWSAMMNRKLSAAPAIAGLLVLPIAGYAAWYLVNDNPFAIGSRTQPELGETISNNAAKNLKESYQRDREEAIERSVSQLSEADDTIENREPAAPTSFRDGMSGVAASKLAFEKRDASDFPSELEANRDRFGDFGINPVRLAVEDPVSTFSIDVDTASYSFVRSALNRGGLPNVDAVRVEELINYFPYDWQAPENASVPFNSTVTIMPTPWNEHTKLMHVAIKGYELDPTEKPRANLVFLIDTSGSMNQPNKLPLLKTAFRMLIDRLDPEDTISIVTYAGSAGTVLEPTKAVEKAKILDVIDHLGAGGSTAGAAGIERAYDLAEKAFVEGGVNRVMLATDGDFNVGLADDESLKRMIEKKRDSGVFLSVFGFGHGNYNDQLMQVLAQNGNGQAVYIDSLAEAQKTLVEEAGSTLFPIAKDVKIQVEFNPARVAEYRLIGYESRALNREDFNNDRVDAGDIGSGHSVTAIYEVTPVGSPAILNDDLRYQATESPLKNGHGEEYAFVKLRYKLPNEDESKLLTTPVTPANEIDRLADAATDVRFSVAVAAFGQKLRKTGATANFGYDRILALASQARGNDPYGYRAEFLSLVRIADALD